MEILADNDFFRIYIDKAYGGLGMGIMGLVLATEELSRACGGIALGLAGTALGVMPLLLAGSCRYREQRHHGLLPKNWSLLF